MDVFTKKEKVAAPIKECALTKKVNALTILKRNFIKQSQIHCEKFVSN